MVRGKGERHAARKLAIAGGIVGLGGAIAGVLAWRRLKDHDSENHLRIDWDVYLDGAQEEADRVASAAVPMLHDSRVGRLMGLFLVEAAPYESHKQEPGTRVAAVVKDGQSGLWRAGVATAPESTLGRFEDEPDARIAAMYLGRQAVEAVVLGTAQEGQFHALPTQLVEVADRDIILDSYPDVPILTSMPPERQQ